MGVVGRSGIDLLFGIHIAGQRHYVHLSKSVFNAFYEAKQNVLNMYNGTQEKIDALRGLVEQQAYVFQVFQAATASKIEEQPED